MATGDPYDPFATDPGSGPDYSGTNPNAVQNPLINQIQLLYQEYLNRSPTDAEIQSHLQNPGGLEGIRQTILQSPEFAQVHPPTTKTGTDQPPPTTPPPTTGPGPTGPTKTGGGQPDPGIGPPPTTTTTFNPGPAPPAITPFSYDPFKAPTADDLLLDPGFKSRLQWGTDALQRSAAARGVLNTGGTLKDILGYGSDLASQEYGNLWNRAKSTYDTNRAGAFSDWFTNNNLSRQNWRDTYDTQYYDPFVLNTGVNQFNAQLGAQQNQFDRSLAFNSRVQDYYQNRTDKNDDFYRRYMLLNYM